MADEGIHAKVSQLIQQQNKDWNFFDSNLGPSGTAVVAEALRGNTVVQTLYLCGNSIGDEGARVLMDALKKNSALKTVNICSNGIGVNGIRAVADALRVNSAMRAVLLDDNDFGDAGAEALAAGLSANSAVREVDVSHAGLGDAGIRAVAHALATNSKSAVRSLCATGNHIGDPGARALAEALKVHPRLRLINLSRNAIGDDGACAFAEALKTNSIVRNLLLGYNSIGDVGAQAMAEALKENTTVLDVYLRDNPIQFQLLRPVEDSVARNKLNYVPSQTTDEDDAPQPFTLPLVTLDAPVSANHISDWLATHAPPTLPTSDPTGSASLKPASTGTGVGPVVGLAACLTLLALYRSRRLGRGTSIVATATGHPQYSELSGTEPVEDAVTLDVSDEEADVEAADPAVTTVAAASPVGPSPVAEASSSGSTITTTTTTTTTAGPPAAAPARKHNRWGDGIAAPAAGTRAFFPHGWVPTCSVLEAVAKFGYEPPKLAFIKWRGEATAADLALLSLHVDAGDAAAVYAYTDEDPVADLYTKCNEACRKAGATWEKRLDLYRDYLHYLTVAISNLPPFRGRAYRGVREVVPVDCYTVGKVVTWQAFTSTTQNPEFTVRFMVRSGKQLSGSLFVLHIKTGKDISLLSAIPGEEEVLIGLNSMWEVTGHCVTAADKKAAVPQLAGYDLGQLDVYVLRQL
eukprot:EG_transcript_4222